MYDERDPQRLARTTRRLGPLLRAYFRPEVRGLDRIPPGACLLVGNHSGGMLTVDTWIFCAALFERGGADAVPYGLGHQAVIEAPVLGPALRRLGGVKAGHGAAEALFAQGRRVLVYPGGDHESLRPFRDRDKIDFGGRKGYARLALRAGVPIVPFASVGAHHTALVLGRADALGRALRLDRLLRFKAFPIALSAPWGITVGLLPPHLPLPTRILIEVLEPIAPVGDEDTLDEAVRERLQAAVNRLATERRQTGRFPWSRQPSGASVWRSRT